MHHDRVEARGAERMNDLWALLMALQPNARFNCWLILLLAVSDCKYVLKTPPSQIGDRRRPLIF